MKKALLLYLLLVSSQYVLFSQTYSEKRSVQLDIEIQETPPQITLNWKPDSTSTGYYIYRKSKSETSWPPALASLTGSDSQYIDNNVYVGEGYEYRVKEITSYPGFGYAYAGIKYPAIENRGTVILIVDDAYVIPLKTEIERLQLDMISDGWQIIRHDVNRADSVPDIKSLIQNDYNTNSNVKTVFLLGHVPVPYSGDFNTPPDGHPDHSGAWPADVYYADVDGTWTDSYATRTNPVRVVNNNAPGDGKFDQNYLPSDVELQIGRVDLYNMPKFSLSDTALLKQYLDKDHNYRIGQITAARRGLVSDNFKGYKEGFATSGYRNFPVMFGSKNITTIGSGQYFSTLRDSSYLWTYGCGGGTDSSTGGIGKTTHFATNKVNSIFNMLFGSYFGDWNTADNILRAPLCSQPSALINFWAGRPHWHLHHLVLGENIGYSTMLAQNNTSSLYDPGLVARGIQIALMGDPTLRMHVVKPPLNLQADSIANVTVQLNWSVSTDDIVGYNIYRTANISQKFERINTDPITDTFYVDSESMDGNNVYMIRAVKLENTGSGTYYNLSQGIFDSASTMWPQGVLHTNNKIDLIKNYPNPCYGKFTIEIEKGNFQQMDLSIFDLFGKTVYYENFKPSNSKFVKTFDITHYSKGVYMLKIKVDDSILHSKIIYQ